MKQFRFCRLVTYEGDKPDKDSYAVVTTESCYEIKQPIPLNKYDLGIIWMGLKRERAKDLCMWLNHRYPKNLNHYSRAEVKRKAQQIMTFLANEY